MLDDKFFTQQKNIDFSLWKKYCNFPKLHFFRMVKHYVCGTKCAYGFLTHGPTLLYLCRTYMGTYCWHSQIQLVGQKSTNMWKCMHYQYLAKRNEGTIFRTFARNLFEKQKKIPIFSKNLLSIWKIRIACSEKRKHKNICFLLVYPCKY